MEWVLLGDPGPRGRLGWEEAPRAAPPGPALLPGLSGTERGRIGAESGRDRGAIGERPAPPRPPPLPAAPRRPAAGAHGPAGRIVRPRRAPRRAPALGAAGAGGGPASSPLAPSMKSRVLCRAAAIVRRGPGPCLGRRPRETGVRATAPPAAGGTAPRRGGRGLGGGRDRREPPGAQGRGRPASGRGGSADARSPELGSAGVRPREGDGGNVGAALPGVRHQWPRPAPRIRRPLPPSVRSP